MIDVNLPLLPKIVRKLLVALKVDFEQDFATISTNVKV